MQQEYIKYLNYQINDIVTLVHTKRVILICLDVHTEAVTSTHDTAYHLMGTVFAFD